MSEGNDIKLKPINDHTPQLDFAIFQVLDAAILILLAVSTVILPFAHSFEHGISLKFNAEHRANEIQKRTQPYGENNYISVYHTPQVHHQFKPLFSRHDPSISTRSQDVSRKTDIREVATGILGTGFLHFLIFLKNFMSDMFYGLHQIYFFR